MKKRIISIMLALALILTLSLITTTPVTANGGDEVFIRISGELTITINSVDYTARVSHIVDSSKGEVTALALFGKPVYNTYVGQWMVGIKGEAELISVDIVGSDITIDIGPMPLYLIPSGDLWATEPNSGVDMVGTISGNKVTLELGPSFSDMTGIIIIK